MTVKTQGGKVITKGGKVSCECCGPPEPPEPEPSCCMYPADQLGILYTGLPETVFAKWENRVNGTMTKSGDTFVSGTVTIARNSSGTAWEFRDSSDNARSTIGNCLIRGDGGFTPENDRVEDQFKDEYRLIAFNQSDQKTFSVIVTRVSQCVWRQLGPTIFERCQDEIEVSEEIEGLSSCRLEYTYKPSPPQPSPTGPVWDTIAFYALFEKIIIFTSDGEEIVCDPLDGYEAFRRKIQNEPETPVGEYTEGGFGDSITITIEEV
jgi:hypothetical protein